MITANQFAQSIIHFAKNDPWDFWLCAAVLLIVATEIFYYIAVNNPFNKRRSKSIRLYIVGYKLIALFFGAIVISILYGIIMIGLLLLENIKWVGIIIASVLAFWLYIEINRIFTNTEPAKHTHNFKKGDTLIVKKGYGGENLGIYDGEKVTFVRNGQYDLIYIKKKNAKFSVSKKEIRFEKHNGRNKRKTN
jgi:hypothetical protein